jgi:Ca2+-binding RTX toxin-like protein
VSQRDVLFGGVGADTLVSAGHMYNEIMRDFPDQLIGGLGADLLVGQHAGMTDFLLTGDGDTVRVRGDENDPISSTVPRFDYRLASGPVLVDLEAGFGQVIGSSSQDILRGMDNADEGDVVWSTNASDQLLGREEHGSGDLQDFLHGRGGNDYIQGRGGNDWLLGYRGDDFLDGGAGDDDRGDGGPGTDTCTSLEGTELCEIIN